MARNLVSSRSSLFEAHVLCVCQHQSLQIRQTHRCIVGDVKMLAIAIERAPLGLPKSMHRGSIAWAFGVTVFLSTNATSSSQLCYTDYMLFAATWISQAVIHMSSRMVVILEAGICAPWHADGFLRDIPLDLTSCPMCSRGL